MNCSYYTRFKIEDQFNNEESVFYTNTEISNLAAI